MRIYPGGGIITLADSEQPDKSFNSKTLFGSAVGMNVDIGFETGTFLNFSLIGNIGGALGSATVQYNYTDIFATQYTVEDYDAVMTSLYGSVGMRFYLLNSSIIKLYAGAGMMYGSISLQYNQEEYLSRKGNISGYEEVESAGYSNTYYEAGLMFFWSQKNGLSFDYKLTDIETKGFETLGGASIKSAQSQYLIKYIHVVDLDFFWK